MLNKHYTILVIYVLLQQTTIRARISIHTSVRNTKSGNPDTVLRFVNSELGFKPWSFDQPSCLSHYISCKIPSLQILRHHWYILLIK